MWDDGTFSNGKRYFLGAVGCGMMTVFHWKKVLFTIFFQFEKVSRPFILRFCAAVSFKGFSWEGSGSAT